MNGFAALLLIKSNLPNAEGPIWILTTGDWNDEGNWNDDLTWID